MLPSKQRRNQHTRDLLIVQVPAPIHLHTRPPFLSGRVMSCSCSAAHALLPAIMDAIWPLMSSQHICR